MTHFQFKIKRLLYLTIICMCLIFFTLFLNHSFMYLRNSFYLSLSSSTDKYPGSFVKYIHSRPANTSYCNMNYGFPRELNFEENDLGFGPELYKNSPYRVLYNVIEAETRKDVPQVTYATHVTFDFVNYIAELVRYWDGYISVAAFVTSSDVATTLDQLNQLCFCLPEMYRVSVNLVFSKLLVSALTKGDVRQKPSSCKMQDYTKITACRNFSTFEMYPVNVCRNVARTAALTEYVLVSDAQLMPSRNLASGFLKIMQQYKFSSIHYPAKVFVVPVFEVEANEMIPRTKEQLMDLIRDERAVYFHRLVCSHCQKFPGLENWFESNPGNSVKPLLTAKREVPYNRWEPIYIGTKNEPYYNEDLSWEGLQDKMPQMLEMCLIGYKFIILDGAFLVHWPGIKKIKNKDKGQWRLPYEKENTRQYNEILKQLSSKYAPNPQCKLQ